MANWLTRISGWLAGKPAGGAGQARRFDGAKQSRLTYGWTTANPAINAELRMDLDALRARARDLSHNNDYARKFLFMAVTNIVGASGFSFSSLAAKPDGTPDKADRDAIEAALADWMQPGECELTGKLAFADLCRLMVRSLARDGEVLLRRVRARDFTYGYRLQLLDIDRLDIRYFDTFKNGNRVVMSVELDTYGRPVAYWLLTQHPGDMVPQGQATQQRERVTAADIFHLFVPERPEQVRGLPWMHTAMARLQMLAGYEEAAIVAARTGAAKMGFFVSPDGTAKGIADDQDDQGNFITDAEAGAFGVLPEGYDFKPWSPEYPTQNYDSFVKSCLRGLASGLNVAYNDLANDLEGVNFSSIRSGTLAERDQWMVLQGWLIGVFLRPVFFDWLGTALLKGAITANGFSLPASRLEKFKAHAWQGRRWSWVDPLKDIEASVMAIDNGLASPYTIAAQQGVDIEDVLDDIARFQAAVEAKKIKLGRDKTPPPTPAPDPAADPTVKAAKIHAEATVRSAELQRDAAKASTPNINITLPSSPEVRVENHIEAPAPAVVPAPEVRIDNHVAAPQVTIEPAAVEVRVEAVMPEQPAPIVEVKVETPDEIAIKSMPVRETTTQIERNNAGDIVKSTQVEADA